MLGNREEEVNDFFLDLKAPIQRVMSMHLINCADRPGEQVRTRDLGQRITWKVVSVFG
jgi:hypothetical protein